MDIDMPQSGGIVKDIDRDSNKYKNRLKKELEVAMNSSYSEYANIVEEYWKCR